jgi:hypothetical protein
MRREVEGIYAYVFIKVKWNFKRWTNTISEMKNMLYGIDNR